MQKEENTTGLPKGWKEVTLWEVVTVQNWYAFKAKDFTTSWTKVIKIKNIASWKITLKDIWFYSWNILKLENYFINKWDILVSMTWSHISQLSSAVAKVTVYNLNEKSLLNQRVGNIKPKWSIDKEYLSFLLKQPSVQIFWWSKAWWSANQANISPDIIKSYNFYLPPLPTQKSIAKILSSFDDKIELLREQNETLEKMGQEIFREWFMLDKNIKKQRLWDLVTVKRWGSPRPIKDYISETWYNWLKISDATATKWPFVFNIKECIKKEGLSKTTHLKKWKLVLSNSATPWMPKILNVDSCIHDGWLHFPESKFSNEFLYLLFIEIRPQLIQQWSWSVFTNLKTDILKNFEAPLPEKSVLDDFDILIKPIFEKIKINSEEIESLSYIRDLLLTKLMKGEVLVWDLEN